MFSYFAIEIFKTRNGDDADGRLCDVRLSCDMDATWMTWTTCRKTVGDGDGDGERLFKRGVVYFFLYFLKREKGGREREREANSSRRGERERKRDGTVLSKRRASRTRRSCSNIND